MRPGLDGGGLPGRAGNDRRPAPFVLGIAARRCGPPRSPGRSLLALPLNSVLGYVAARPRPPRQTDRLRGMRGRRCREALRLVVPRSSGRCSRRRSYGAAGRGLLGRGRPRPLLAVLGRAVRRDVGWVTRATGAAPHAGGCRGYGAPAMVLVGRRAVLALMGVQGLGIAWRPRRRGRRASGPQRTEGSRGPAHASAAAAVRAGRAGAVVLRGRRADPPRRLGQDWRSPASAFAHDGGRRSAQLVRGAGPRGRDKRAGPGRRPAVARCSAGPAGPSSAPTGGCAGCSAWSAALADEDAERARSAAESGDRGQRPRRWARRRLGGAGRAAAAAIGRLSSAPPAAMQHVR